MTSKVSLIMNILLRIGSILRFGLFVVEPEFVVLPNKRQSESDESEANMDVETRSRNRDSTVRYDVRPEKKTQA